MKKMICMITAIVLCMAMCGCSAAAGAGLTVSGGSNSTDISKEETVYIISDTSGAPKQTIVSEWLKNADKVSELADVSSLSDIENVKGDETFTQNGENLNWAVSGNDIYYRGNSTATPPVSISISYKLDGKDIDPAQLAGKSGKVTINIKYTNNEKRDVNGKTMYVPFIAASMIALDSDKFKNVTVSDGTVASEGSRTGVVCAGAPGMNESLSLTGDDKLPDSFEITADVTDFELETIISFATNQPFAEFDETKLDDLDGMRDDLDDLVEAAEKLVDGCTDLYDGIAKADDGVTDLTGGVDKLVSGSSQLKSGTSELKTGAAELAAGAKTLDSKVGELKTGMKKANAGAVKVSGGTATLAAKMAELSAGADAAAAGTAKLEAGFTTMDAGLSQLSDGVDKAYGALSQTIGADEKVIEALKAYNEQAQDATIEQLIDVLESSVSGQKQVASSMTGKGDMRTGVSALQKGVSDSLPDVKKLVDGTAEMSAGGKQLLAGLQDLSKGSSDLSSGISDAYDGVSALKKGTKELSDACTKAAGGASKLDSGAGDLNSGLSQLKDGVGDLDSGMSELKDGASDLKDGAEKFKTEGIDVLYDKLANDLLNKVDDAKELLKLAREYGSYGGRAEGMSGRSTFIYRTESISTDSKDN